MSEVFIDCSTLHNLNNPHLRLLDLRWSLQERDGYADFCAGHIPGALYVDLETDLTGQADPLSGRHPLPSAHDLEESIRSWGIDRDSFIVVYDDSHGLAAARAWWLLRWAGCDNVLILNGGWEAWSDDYEIATGASDVVERSDFIIRPHSMPTIDTSQVLAHAKNAILLDARAHQRYLGQEEPVDSHAGHIPGAINSPTDKNLDESDMRFFRPSSELSRYFSDMGIDQSSDIAVYCGSGVTACHTIAALASIDIDAALYPPSWSGWIASRDHPIATGEEKDQR